MFVPTSLPNFLRAVGPASFHSQAVNFSCYQIFKTQLSQYLGRDELASWQHMLLGGLSGGIGPCVNNPLDVVKTRLQKQVRACSGVPPLLGEGAQDEWCMRSWKPPGWGRARRDAIRTSQHFDYCSSARGRWVQPHLGVVLLFASTTVAPTKQTGRPSLKSLAARLS